MTVGNYDRIQDLAIGQGRVTIDQNRFPVLISETEKGTIDFHRVQRIVSNNRQVPSAIAGLQPNELTPTVDAINHAFLEAMDSYADQLVLSCASDKERVTQLDRELRDRIAQQPNWAWRYAMYGLPFFLIGAIPGYLIGKEKNKSQTKANQQDKINVLREGSAHRRTWMVSVDTSEKNRIRDTKAIIMARAQVLFTELEELAQRNQFDVSRQDELTQLNRVYNVIFPDEPLTIEGRTINDYLENLGGNL